MSQQKEMSKRQLRRQQIKRKNMRGRLIWTGFITLVALFFGFVVIWPNIKPAGTVLTPEAFSRPNPDANAAGDPNAPIKIEEFGDFQCPHCLRFYENTERQLVETYVADGTVYFVYHSFGDFIGPESAAAAEAAYCAGDQGKFWEMHDVIFKNQTGENVGAYTDKRLEAFAGTLGIDMGEFTSCFDDGKYADKVDEDAKSALAAGISATPSFLLTYVVDGETKTKILQGAQPIEVFTQEIEAALAEMGQ
jgi:protein-disulfide isomerase